MLLAQFFEYLIGWLSTASPEVGVSFPNSRYGLTIILLLPFEICRNDIIQSSCGVLAVALRVSVELRSAFRRK